MDLSVRIKPSSSDRDLAPLLRRAYELGWRTIAWNQVVLGKGPAKSQTKPRPPVVLSTYDVQSTMAIRSFVVSPPNTMGKETADVTPVIKQLNRLTVVLDDVIDAQTMAGSEQARAFDLLAAVPGNGKVFNFLCRNGGVDIISLDLSSRLPFSLNGKVVAQAIKRGIRFEIVYGGTFQSAVKRQNILGGATHLLQLLRGSSIVLSSGADAAPQMRGPYEAICVGEMLGMTAKQAHSAVYSTPASAIQNATLRRNRFSSAEIISADKFSTLAKAAEQKASLTKKQRRQLMALDAAITRGSSLHYDGNSADECSDDEAASDIEEKTPARKRRGGGMEAALKSATKKRAVQEDSLEQIPAAKVDDDDGFLAF